MLFLIPTAGALALASLVVALPRTGPVALESNLAYRSPSTTVEYLKIDTQDVYDGLGKRWTDTYTGKLEFPSGVASGDPFVAPSDPRFVTRSIKLTFIFFSTQIL